MKVCSTEQEFITYVAPFAQRVCKRYGMLPSVIIAQAAQELGYAIRSYWDNESIAELLKYNDMLGQKAELLTKSWSDYSVWNGISFSKKTPEWYGGKKVIITDKFRVFDDVEQSFADYVLFLLYASNEGYHGKPKYGKEVVSIKDYATLIKTIGAKGYATDPAYAQSVIKIIQKHNLTRFDVLTGVSPTNYIPPALKEKKEDDPMSITINKKYITTNDSYDTNHPVAIVIHNTDNYDAGADAKAHAEWLYTDNNTGMSWHYAVDDHSIYQCLPHNRGAFHVGRNYGTNNLFSKYGGRDNKNTIAIEMCVNKGFNYEKAFQNTVALTKHLMKQLNIPASRVFQHWDICSKECPSEIRKRGDWGRFKNLISGSTPTPTPTPEPTVEKWYRIRKSWSDAASQIGAYKSLDNAKENCPKGYAVFDWNGKEVYRPAVTFADKFLNECQKIVDVARLEKWTYGDSHSTQPCADHVISCDRLPSRANYDLGYTDQRQGGETCGTLPDWLPKHGWVKVTDRKKIVSGAIVAVRNKDQNFINHVFVVKSYNVNTDMCDKYDEGSNDRIKTVQPFKSVPLVEWSDRVFVCAWNPPSDKPQPTPKPDDRTWNGVDYAPVYNYTYYKKKYPDLQKAFGNDKAKYFDHFCHYGMKECRQACSAFNVKKYKERYADLRKAFGDNYPEYYKHYCVYGKKEGRKGN